MKTYTSQHRTFWQSSSRSDRSKRFATPDSTYSSLSDSSLSQQASQQASQQQETNALTPQQSTAFPPTRPWGTLTNNVARTLATQPLDSSRDNTLQPKSTHSLQMDRLANNAPIQRLQEHIQRQAKRQAKTGPEKQTQLPERLKASVENLSGISMDDVKVHYNSAKPSQLKALAYTKGADIYLGPGQQHHLPHETWHVVQQKQGRVRPTVQAKGENINDNVALEREADVMGQKALHLTATPQPTAATLSNSAHTTSAHTTAPHTAIQRLATLPGENSGPASLNSIGQPRQSNSATLPHQHVVQMMHQKGIVESDKKTYVPMGCWASKDLSQKGHQIYTDAMTSCVTIAMYNDKSHAIIAHFGSLKTEVDHKKDVRAGMVEIKKRMVELKGHWQGYVFTGIDNQISQERIAEIQLCIAKGLLKEKESRHQGVTVYNNGHGIKVKFDTASKVTLTGDW